MADTGLQDGRFLLLEALGRGGMGRVFRAFDRAEQRIVALKVLHAIEPHGPRHPLSIEFAAWVTLRHPNIVAARELRLAHRGPLPPGLPYLVLEHVRGGPIHRILRPGRIDPLHHESIARQLLAALAHVHAAGWAHRDLKPGNVLARPVPRAAPQVKLTDFGLAAPVGRVGQPGVISGSVAHVAPETILGRPVDVRSDLYGLGILLYQLAAGATPFPPGDAGSILRWHVGGPPADLAPLVRTTPRFSALVGRLIERDPDRRPASASRALAGLGAGIGDLPAPARPRRSAADRAARARLASALEAVQRGEARAVDLEPPHAERLLEGLAIDAQLRGIVLHRVRDRAVDGPASLPRVVLRLLAERGATGSECRGHGLAGALPIGIVGGQALLDPATPALDADPTRRAAAVSRFLLRCAATRPTLIAFEGPALGEPLVRAVIERLGRAVRAGRVEGTGGGLLVLTAPLRLAEAI